MLDLTPDQLLTTTRAVRKRLDLARPVERSLIEECIRIAQQAPTGSNRQGWHFVVVTDPSKRAGLADLYRKGAEDYIAESASEGRSSTLTAEEAAVQARVASSAMYLIEHIHEVPVHVIPCIWGRTEGMPTVAQAAMWCSIVPAAWSFMLAARARGLGTAMTSFHLSYEREAAELLGIPFDRVTQAALIPLAYSKGVNFKPGSRRPLSNMVHWNSW